MHLPGLGLRCPTPGRQGEEPAALCWGVSGGEGVVAGHSMGWEGAAFALGGGWRGNRSFCLLGREGGRETAQGGMEMKAGAEEFLVPSVVPSWQKRMLLALCLQTDSPH